MSLFALDPLFTDGVDLGIVMVVLIKTVIAFAVPLVLTALMIWPRQRSSVSTAEIVAGMFPVWPTMSAFAKLATMAPKRSEPIARTASFAISGALICGWRS